MFLHCLSAQTAKLGGKPLTTASAISAGRDATGTGGNDDTAQNYKEG